MICEHWENDKTEVLSLVGYCKLNNQMCYCNGVKEDCDYKKEENDEGF